jgi:hypothetical protein
VPIWCRYCFADFSQYERPLSFADVEHFPGLLEGIDVIYPACDVDLFATSKPLDVLRRAASLGPSISVSTKAALSDKLVTGLATVTEELQTRDRILKIGISISTKRNCGALEPRAARYAARLENLRLLQRASVPSCLVLKPILSDVPLAEYCEIVSNAAGLTECILIGDEYLDMSTPRISPGVLSQRPVGWAVNQPTWPVSVHAEHKAAIKRYAERLGFSVFDSDLELMAALTKLAKKEEFDSLQF